MKKIERKERETRESEDRETEEIILIYFVKQKSPKNLNRKQKNKCKNPDNSAVHSMLK